MRSGFNPHPGGYAAEKQIPISKTLLPLVALALFSLKGEPVPSEAQLQSLILLEKGDTQLGILAEVGGRPVLLRHASSPNLLFAEPSFWPNATHLANQSMATREWIPFNGHILWIGPQVDFWNDQDLHPDRRGERWPPDPFLTLMPFEVSAQSTDSVSLRSPASPVSGLQLEQVIQITEPGKIRLEATATNIRDRAVTKDLWSNTRLPADARFFVPIRQPDDVRMDLLGRAPLPTRMEGGFFRFDLEAVQLHAEGDPWANKAFVTPRLPYIAAFTDHHVFIKCFEPIPSEQVHPDHAPVEIYLDLPRSDRTGLLELEAHGPLRTLAPGERMQWWETWWILPYDGPDDAAIQQAFLRRWEKGKRA